jgi:hypothetical protein
MRPPRRNRVEHGQEGTPIFADGVLYQVEPWGAVSKFHREKYLSARWMATWWHWMQAVVKSFGARIH